MRHALLGALAAVAIAAVLVLVLAEEEVAEDAPPTATTETRPWTVTETVGPRATGHGGDPVPGGGLREADRIEQAVIRYVEAAERGEVDSPGLPTSDELAFERTSAGRGRARVRLVGGATLRLRRRGGRWRVVHARAPIPEPTPPSNGP